MRTYTAKCSYFKKDDRALPLPLYDGYLRWGSSSSRGDLNAVSPVVAPASLPSQYSPPSLTMNYLRWGSSSSRGDLYAVSAAAVPPLTISSTVASGPNLSFWTSSWPAGQTFTWTPSARINSCSIPSCTHRTLGYCEKHKKLCKILLIFGFAPARHIFSRHCVVFLVFKVARRRLRHCATFWL